MFSTTLLFSVLAALGAQAATKDEWRSRSIYQVLTDRFAPVGIPAHCDNTRNYCGGTWRGLADRLDYIQGMGFDAVWISPTGAGVEGDTKWGQNYHGYWVVDPAAPNEHFGTQEDLEYLSKSLHDRGMYLMVDVVPNHLASTTTDISDEALANKEGGRLFFKNHDDYHPACGIEWGNADSEQKCWLAQDGVALMDLATENPAVADKLNDFIRNYSATGLFDGYRVDAVKHVSKDFSHTWCQNGGNFCIGEYYDQSTDKAAELTRGDGIDSVFGFGMMYGAVGVFAEDKPMSVLTNYASEATIYGDPSVVGTILDNHDLPRFGSITADKSKTYNALTLQFLFGGIPTVYYGFEADITFGSADPDNRDPLWHHTDYSGNGETYGRIKRLNAIRQALGKRGDFLAKVATTKAQTDNDVAFERNGLLMVLTKRGAGVSNEWTIEDSGLQGNVVDLLTCKTYAVGADGFKVTFDNGMPFAFVNADVAAETGICATENDRNGSFDQPSVTQVSQDPTQYQEQSTDGGQSDQADKVNQGGQQKGPQVEPGQEGDKVEEKPQEGNEPQVEPVQDGDKVEGRPQEGNEPQGEEPKGQGKGGQDTAVEQASTQALQTDTQGQGQATPSMISEAGISPINKATSKSTDPFQSATTLNAGPTASSKACKRSRARQMAALLGILAIYI